MPGSQTTYTRTVLSTEMESKLPGEPERLMESGFEVREVGHRVRRMLSGGAGAAEERARAVAPDRTLRSRHLGPFAARCRHDQPLFTRTQVVRRAFQKEHEMMLVEIKRTKQEASGRMEVGLPCPPSDRAPTDSFPPLLSLPPVERALSR